MTQPPSPTRSPRGQPWTEPHDHCQVPHHGAFLLPELRYRELRPQLPPSLAEKVLCHSTGFILSECVSECVAPSLSRNCTSYSNLVNLACIILVTSLLCICFISCCKIVALHLSHLPLHNTPINLLPVPHNFPRFIVNKLLWKCSQFVFVFSFIGPAWFGSEVSQVFIPDNLFILAGTFLAGPLGCIRTGKVVGNWKSDPVRARRTEGVVPR